MFNEFTRSFWAKVAGVAYPECLVEDKCKQSCDVNKKSEYHIQGDLRGTFQLLARRTIIQMATTFEIILVPAMRPLQLLREVSRSTVRVKS